ncbi:hypothetical protein PG999_001040 [Apiospora kogelbergensis]|uniref:Uncharacterized protein n=1 Tax=Apiospora kogelbergensis TaxID=1337665 RepID=A0AAW0RD71_9PEZI
MESLINLLGSKVSQIPNRRSSVIFVQRDGGNSATPPRKDARSAATKPRSYGDVLAEISSSDLNKGSSNSRTGKWRRQNTSASSTGTFTRSRSPAKNAPKEIAIPEDDVALLPPVVYSPPAAESAGISISSRHSFIPKPSDYCSGCETTHARNEFSPWQRAARDHERLCLGREGSFSLCRHQRINFGAIEQALPRTQLSTTTAGVILRCEDESHLKGTRHHLDRSARLDDEAMMPQVSVGIEEDGAVMLSTYFEELVCIVPAGEPLLVRQLRQKLDLLQAASTNCICGHVNINSERIVDLAESISCPYLHEAEGGCQVSVAATLGRSGHGGEEGSGRESEGRCCDMKDSIGFCDTCDDTWFGFRRWRGRPDAEYHEIWLFGLSYISFQGGFKPDCHAWRQRLD